MVVDKNKLVHELKKNLKLLRGIRGSGTELISLYITPGYPMGEVSGKLREEFGQASNIKSKSTRKNVLEALEKILNYLKMFRAPPDNGIAIFCGNISKDPGRQNVQLFSIVTPEPLLVQFYRCDSTFALEPLEEMIGPKDAYGLVVMDGREATLATLRGKQVRIIRTLNSTAHSKVSKGGQCLAGETLVHLCSGEIKQVDELSGKFMIKGADLSSNLIGDRECSDVFVTSSKKCLLVRTREPSAEIMATPHHRFFKLGEFGLEEIFASRLKRGDLVAVAGSIKHMGKGVPTGFLPKKKLALDANELRRLRRHRNELGFSQLAAAKLIGVSQMSICKMENGKIPLSLAKTRELYLAYGMKLAERFRRDAIKFPKHYTREIAQLFGMICGDGTLDVNRTTVYEGSEEMASAYAELIKRTLGVVAVIKKVDKTRQKGSFAKKPYYEIRIYSGEFARALKETAPEITRDSSERDIPNAILKCNDKVCAAFFKGLFDAEGCLNGRRVEIAGTSRRLLQKSQLALLRFGVRASFLKKKTTTGRQQWSLSISDFASVKNFREKIGFTRTDKRQALERIGSLKRNQQYVARTPASGREVFRLAKRLGLRVSDFHAASCFFRDLKPLGKAVFEKSIEPVMLARAAKLGRLKEVRGHLKRWLKADIAIARVSEVKEVEKKGDYFDLTIPVHSNFVANSFIVHNSARRYQRLVEESIENYYKRIGEAMDKAFLQEKLNGVIVGGPGPAKENFLKLKPFHYETKILGSVDTGYTNEYGVRELMEKASDLISGQESIMEKKLVDRFIREVVKDGLVTYGEKEVRSALESGKAERLLVSESLALKRFELTCTKCNAKETKLAQSAEDLACSCGGKFRVDSETDILDELVLLAEKKEIPIDLVSADTSEGNQFLMGFRGIGAFLRYR